MKYKITLLPGDGIGTEIMEAAVSVLKAVEQKYQLQFQLKQELFGGASIDKFGEPLTKKTLQACFSSDAVLLGAVGGYSWESLEHHNKPEAGLLALRKSLGLFANIRPAKVYTGLLNGSSLKNEMLEGTDFVVFRELTGGIYFAEPRGMDDQSGWNTMRYSKPEVIRIAKLAFEAAQKRKKEIVSVDKANVLECSQFWRQTVAELSHQYPDVKLQNMYVDNTAMQMVRNPRQFDVILTSNLFGDILSDIAGAISGSLGMLPSASLGERYALYEPVHGSAPDIAGQNKANPIAMIASVAMMFEFSFQQMETARNIENAIKKTLEQGYRTADILGEGEKPVSTTEMTEKILQNLN